MEWVSGNIFIRSNEVSFGRAMQGHCHDFHHTSIFWPGLWRAEQIIPLVDAQGKPLVGPSGQQEVHVAKDITREGPFHLGIEEKCWHRFTYMGNPIPPWMEPYVASMPAEKAVEFRDKWRLQEGKMWCVYSHRTPQGDVVQNYNGWEAAYQ